MRVLAGVLVWLCVSMARGDAMAVLSGTVTTENGDPLACLEMAISGDRTQTTLTDTNGFYAFRVPAGGDYTITPIAPEDGTNGVSELDVDLITAHILGITRLSSPLKIIAADVTKNGAIAALDLIEIGRLLDGTITEFPNNTAWTFVVASYVFPNPENPFFPPFPRQIDFHNVTGDVAGNDFTAARIGDVDNSATPGFCTGDLDGDGDIDRDDFDAFAACSAGPGGRPPAGCGKADLDGDGDVDLADFAAFQGAFTGAQ